MQQARRLHGGSADTFSTSILLLLVTLSGANLQRQGWVNDVPRG
jgi:hypothetical protein